MPSYSALFLLSSACQILSFPAYLMIVRSTSSFKAKYPERFARGLHPTQILTSPSEQCPLIVDKLMSDSDLSLPWRASICMLFWRCTRQCRRQVLLQVPFSGAAQQSSSPPETPAFSEMMRSLKLVIGCAWGKEATAPAPTSVPLQVAIETWENLSK